MIAFSNNVSVFVDTIKFSLTDTDFVNVPPSHSLDSLHKMVAEHGGAFSMNLNNSVTHCVAAESKGSLSFSLPPSLYPLPTFFVHTLEGKHAKDLV